VIEAGIQLRGTEVKSLRAGRIEVKRAYADIRDGELWLVGVHIAPYEQAPADTAHDPTGTASSCSTGARSSRWRGRCAERGFTLVPTRLYFKDGRVKVELALARGKETIRQSAATWPGATPTGRSQRALKSRRS